MSKPVLFFASLCPDTTPFVAELNRLNVEYEAVEIMSSMVNFKRFLRLRDNHSAFEEAKANGYIGIPALLLADETVILDINQLQGIFG
ncbi:glutaredoxin-like protein [Pasteurella multocida subsp. multocida OH4807]|nr:glutaredoxin-like protein [Pasteurella multocida subsp. multocida OH4807]